MSEFQFADDAPSSSFKFEEDDSLTSKSVEFGKALAGGAEAGAELLPKMLIGAGAYSAGAAKEALEGETRAIFGKGEPATLESVTGAGEQLAQKSTDWRMMDEAKPVEEAFGKAFSSAIEGVGNLAEQIAMHPMGPYQYKPAEPGTGFPGIRSAAEAASQFIPAERLFSGFKGGKVPLKESTIKPEEPTFEYVPGPKRDIAKQGTRDITLTDTQIPTIEPDTTLAYTFKNKEVLDKFHQYDLRRGSDMQGMDFTSFSLEDPKQLEHLQGQLKDLGVDSDITQTRTLAAQMKDKAALADERVKGLPQTITKRIPPIAIDPEKVIEGYKRINASPMNAHVELVDTRLMELMRDHDRLTEPKGLQQFLHKENSVLEGGVHKGLTLAFWPEENRIVQTNGNSRRGIAAKHGMMEIPAYVRIMAGKVPEEWQRTAVSIPGLKFEGKAEGQFAKPSEIGLPSRTLNEGVFNPQIKYAPDPTVDSVKVPAGHFMNNYLFAIQHSELSQFGARKGLNVVRDTSSIPFYREVAKLLLNDKEFNPQFAIRHFGDEGYKDSTRGQYRPSQHEISVRKDSIGSEYVFMHESIHAATLSALNKLQYGQLDRMHPAYDGAKRLTDLWQSLKTSSEVENLGSPGVAVKGSPLSLVIEQYGLTNVHEFVAEAFTNPEFQNLLKQISLPDHLQTKGFQYYWDAFVKALGDLIGIKSGQQNYLAATISAGAELMRKSNKQDRMFYALEQKPESWYPRATGVEGGPDFVSNMIENKQLLAVDRRPLAEVVKEKGINADSIKDLDNGDQGNLLQRMWGLAKLSGRNMADARTIQQLNKAVAGTGDILKNIGDRIFLADRWVKSQVEETMKGKEFKEGFTGRFVHRFGSRDGVDPTMKALGDKDANEMLKHWLPNVGKKDLTRTDFPNDKQWNAYNVLHNQLDRALGIVNDLRQKMGLPVMDPVKSFFPASRGRGDYKVVVKDSMGNVRDISTFESVYEANDHVKDMKEKFPYTDVSEPFHREPYKAEETDYSVWAEAERINSSDNELSKLIQQAKVTKFTRYGMGGHLLKRRLGEDIAGYMGSDFSPRGAREGLQQYFEYLYNYAGNLSKGLVEKDLNELRLDTADGKGKTLAEAAPNLDSYLHQFTAKAKGAHNVLDQSEQVFFGLVSKAAGFGTSAPTRGMAKMSRFAMVWYLFKTQFFATQPIQTFNALPHLVDMTGSLVKSSQHFLEGWSRAIFPTEADKGAVNWAIRNEYIDPTTSHLLDEYNASVPTRVFLRTTGTIERELVRIPALLMFEHALRDTVKDPNERYAQAAEKMAYSMSMTSRSNSPLLWEKLGIVGQGMRQLKSYSTNIWGQFTNFMQMAGQGNYKPLATFLGTEALVGGVKGVIGVAEATALITWFNYWTNSNVKTPTEMMLTAGAPDSLTYGLASTVTGRDVSNQVGNPSGFNYFDPIPFKLAYDITSQNAEYVKAVAQNQMTDSIRLKTWLANTPPALHESIRNYFNKEGQPVPSPFLNMGGTYFRDEKQKVLSSATGARSIEETKADDLQRFFKQHEQRLISNKSETQNAMVDDILNGSGVDPKKIQDYMQQGGSPGNLANDLKSTMIERHRSSIFNQIVNKSKTPSQAKKLQDVQPYLENQPKNIFPPTPEFKFADE